jgi:hypothetical protein
MFTQVDSLGAGVPGDVCYVNGEQGPHIAHRIRFAASFCRIRHTSIVVCYTQNVHAKLDLITRKRRLSLGCRLRCDGRVCKYARHQSNSSYSLSVVRSRDNSVVVCLLLAHLATSPTPLTTSPPPTTSTAKSTTTAKTASTTTTTTRATTTTVTKVVPTPKTTTATTIVRVVVIAAKMETIGFC